MWEVIYNKQVDKQLRGLPQKIQDLAFALMQDIRISGAVRGEWPNYGKLARTVHHCHLKKGKPCYVAVWEEKDKTIQLIEIKYVGTHENAPY